MTTAPTHKYGQVTAFSRSDLHITASALRAMKKEKSIEVGIKITCGALLDDMIQRVVVVPEGAPALPAPAPRVIPDDQAWPIGTI